MDAKAYQFFEHLKIMAHRIDTARDFVFGIKGQGKDWHGLTIEHDKLTRDLFHEYREGALVILGTDGNPIPTEYKGLIHPDGKLVGVPYADSRRNVMPREAFDMMAEALAGTKFNIERMGNLRDGSLWFVSIDLEELKKVATKGHKFQLNFYSGFDGKDAFSADLSDIRVVCNNTLSLSRATGENLFWIKQTKKNQAKLDGIKRDVEKAVGMARIFNETLASLESAPVTADEAREVYAGELSRSGAKFERSLVGQSKGVSIVNGKPMRIEIVDGKPAMIEVNAPLEYRESRALNTLDALLADFKRGDGNKGATRADVLNGYTQHVGRGGATEREDKLTTFAQSEFAIGADRKAEFFKLITRPESKTGKNRVASGWDELRANGQKALELAGAK